MNVSESDGLKILVPYVAAEAIELTVAAKVTGRSAGTIRGWCLKYGIGRRIVGGPWQVSRLALQMLLDGNTKALLAYQTGDRHGDLVAPYVQRFNLSREFERSNA
jgi:hypothetical protein